MNVKHFICSLLLLSSYPAISQETSLKEGIYKSIDEFRNNAPSVSLDGVRIKNSVKLLANGPEKYESDWDNELKRNVQRYTSIVTEIEVKVLFDIAKGKKIKNRDFWGFSDGEHIYINSRSHIKEWHYTPLLLRGKLLYFIQTGYPTSVKYAQQNNYFILEEYIIAPHSGKVMRLTKTKLMELVQDNPKVFKLVKEEKYNLKHRFEDYIKLYNREQLIDQLKKKLK